MNNYDGTEMLGALSVADGTVLTAEELNRAVPAPENRPLMIFAGWSPVPDDGSANYSARDSYTVSSDMELYAVYRTLQPEDVDRQLLGDLAASAGALEEAVKPMGLTMRTLSQTPERDPEFYAYLEEYLESRFPEEMAALRELESQEAFDETPFALSKDRECYEHAYNDAEWMLTKRPDVDFGKEIVYQYTSHCIDVLENSVGTFIPCTVDSPSNYLTDLDRRTYDLFYSKASGITIYKNLTSLIGLATSRAVENGVELVSAIRHGAKMSEKGFEIANRMSDVYDLGKAIGGLSNTAYADLANLQYTSKEELFAYLDALVDALDDSLNPDYGEWSRDYARNGFFAIASVMLGGPVYCAAASMLGSGGSFIAGILDKANYLAMRMYIQTRVAERLWFSWGMGDGRN